MLHTSLYSRGHPSWTDFTLWWLPKAYLRSNSGWNNNDLKFKIKQYLFPMVQLPLVGQGLIIIDTSLPHSGTPSSVGLLWKGNQLDAENSDNTQHSEEIHPCPGEILTHTVNRPAPGIGKIKKTEICVCMCELLLWQNFARNISTFLDIWLAVHHSITYLLLPTSYTNFLFIHTNYIKLNSSTCFELNPLIIRRSTT